MTVFDRSALVKIHLLLAAFIFPVALMFLITGGLYTWGVKGSYNSDVHLVTLGAPLSADAEPLTEVVEQELQRLGVALPSGSASVKKTGTSFMLEWTGADRDVLLEPTTDSLSARLTIKETTWYRNFVQLHKAKGGQPFKVYAALLAVSLFMILLSGFIVAWQVPRYRRLTMLASAAGIGMFLVMFFAS